MPILWRLFRLFPRSIKACPKTLGGCFGRDRSFLGVGICQSCGYWKPLVKELAGRMETRRAARRCPGPCPWCGARRQHPGTVGAQPRSATCFTVPGEVWLIPGWAGEGACVGDTWGLQEEEGDTQSQKTAAWKPRTRRILLAALVLGIRCLDNFFPTDISMAHAAEISD